ncbi:MAG: xanthine dehydrogenase family protein subunit M [Deltaproteobacteria bacterium]|nr:xanthine dehydrogenase family protein subunit M [Deltaproteobacteria bacterium]
MKNFDYFAPKSLPEVQEILAAHSEGSFLMAGGTDLMMQMKSKVIAPKCVIDLKGLGLNYIKPMEDGLAVGAATTLHEIEASPLIKEKCPVMAATCSEMSCYSIRHMGTLGGNLCNASPSADTAPPLIVLGASARISGPDGERIVPVEDLLTAPGQTVLKKGEILIEIRIPPLPPRSGAVYLKYKRNEGMDLALVGVAVCMVMDGSGTLCQDIRIALGAVAPAPLRASAAETVLRGNALEEELFEKAALKAREAAEPITDVRGSADYRAALVQTLTRDALRQLKEAVVSG